MRVNASSRPRTAATSKMGGEAVRPVNAARKGWAMSPSFKPSFSAKIRVRVSSDGGFEVMKRQPIAAPDPAYLPDARPVPESKKREPKPAPSAAAQPAAAKPADDSTIPVEF